MGRLCIVNIRIDCRTIDHKLEGLVPERSRVNSEGCSIYFYDYNNHLFEVHNGTLNARLERYFKGK